jgi:ubiquitin-protein ligase
MEVGAASAKQITEDVIDLEMEKCTYTGENLVTQYKQHKEIIEFLITSAIAAIKSDRCDIIFNPYPKTWQSIIYTCDTINNKISRVIEILNIKLNVDLIISVINESYTDKEIIEKLDINTYGLIKFVLMSNKIFIKPYSLLTQEDVISVGYKVTVNSDNNVDKTVKQFKVIHTPLKEDEFKSKDTMFLFHGTQFSNAYSIMVNDIKIGSKSKYFMNGAAHGDGIYLSNQCSLSLGYSTNTLGKDLSDKRILFIFEVLKNPYKNDWKKVDGIYVVDDESSLILRFILYFSNSSKEMNEAIFNAINLKLNSGKIKEQEKKQTEMEVKNIGMIRQKRLMREYGLVSKSDPEKLGFRVKMKDDSKLDVWFLEMFCVDNEKLQKQMEKLNIPFIEMEITFKENYPFEPPFVRIVYPHFVERKGHITIGGSFCVDILTTQKWSSANSIETLMIALKLIMLIGNAEIDESKPNKRYNLEEAIDAFNRALKKHNWV